MVRFAVLSTIYAVSIAAFFAAYAGLPVSADSSVSTVPAGSVVAAAMVR